MYLLYVIARSMYYVQNFFTEGVTKKKMYKLDVYKKIQYKNK